VWDNGPGGPRRAQPGTDDENGRGLAIIDALTGRNWGWRHTPCSGGKVIWAALPVPADTPAPMIGTLHADPGVANRSVYLSPTPSTGILPTR
jgi:hypothetical protein